MIVRNGFRLAACPRCGRYACMFGDRGGLKWFLELDGVDHACWVVAKMHGDRAYEQIVRAMDTMYDVLAVRQYLPDGVEPPARSLWDGD